MEKLDLLFALSATALKSDDNFIKMKSVIAEILNTHGSSSVRYSIITFGKYPDVELDFQEQIDSKGIRARLQNISKNSEGVDLSRALKKASELLNNATLTRPDAKRIVVLAMDKTSDSDETAVDVAAKSLAQDGVRVIAVTFGKEGDPQEIAGTTLNKDNVIETDESDTAKDIAVAVMEKAMNGKCLSDSFYKSNGPTINLRECPQLKL